MEAVKFSWFLIGLALLADIAFGVVHPKIIASKIKGLIDKRSPFDYSPDVNVNVREGMRDFIYNGKPHPFLGWPFLLKRLIAFQATLTSGDIGPNYSNGAIKFNDVSLNVGKAYASSSGKFTAPCDGVFQFSLSYLQKKGYSSYVRIMKGNVAVSDLHANHKSYDQLSKTILVQLNKGEKVWVKLENKATYAVYGRSRYTQFSGMLVSPLKPN